MAAKFIVGRDGFVKARQVNIEFRDAWSPRPSSLSYNRFARPEATSRRSPGDSGSLWQRLADDISAHARKPALSRQRSMTSVPQTGEF